MLASWTDRLYLVRPWGSETVFKSDMGVICKSKPLFFLTCCALKEGIWRLFLKRQHLQSYSEKSHVLYMAMLSGSGISVHSLEPAT